MNARRIQSILKDEDFTALVDRMKANLTAKVMAVATSEDDRAAALTQFHALGSLIGMMGSTAQDAEDDT